MPEVQYKKVCNCAHEDSDHKVRHYASAQWKNTHTVDGLIAVSECPCLHVGTRFTAASVSGRYTIVTIVSKRMFPFCSKASLPSATDEAEKSWAGLSQRIREPSMFIGSVDIRHHVGSVFPAFYARCDLSILQNAPAFPSSPLPWLHSSPLKNLTA